jgi:hypothetical protein
VSFLIAFIQNAAARLMMKGKGRAELAGQSTPGTLKDGTYAAG